MKRTIKTTLVFILIAGIAFLYPPKAGVSQSKAKVETLQHKKILPKASDLENPKSKLADGLQAEIKQDRAEARAIESETIRILKEQIAQKNKANNSSRIVYRTIYKKSIDTIFIPVPVGSVYEPSDSTDYAYPVNKCKPDTVYIKKKGIFNRFFDLF